MGYWWAVLALTPPAFVGLLIVSSMSKVKTPVLLVIMDGWGLTAPGSGNAISQAHMQTVEG